MKCPRALTKACIVRKVGQEIFLIEHSLQDLTKRMKSDEERAETELLNGRVGIHWFIEIIRPEYKEKKSIQHNFLF